MSETPNWLLAWLLLGAGSACWAAEPKPEALQPGLLATYRDTIEILRLEPTIAVAWKAGEAGHPRLRRDGGTIAWKGQVKLVRGGDYHFAVRLRGVFRLTIDEKEVLREQVHDAEALLKQGNVVSLEPGVHAVNAEYQRLPGLARVEVLWQGPGFRMEPLPSNLLGHYRSAVPVRFETELSLERGRFLAEELNCLRCHRADDSDKIAAGLVSRQAPDLSQIGQRAHAGWLERWLESPKRMRPDAVMPELFSRDQVGRAEQRAVASYLASLGGPVKITAPQISPDNQRHSRVRGQVLFQVAGCIACHREPLAGLGSKTTPELLAQYLVNPLVIDPSGRMPGMSLQAEEAADLARFLCSSVDDAIRPALSAPPAREHLLAAFARVENRAEERAQFEKLPAEKQWLDLGKRLVIEKGCNNCHTIAPDGKPFAAMQASADWNDLSKPATHNAGCLADKADRRGRAPWFDLEAKDLAALRLFLKEGVKGAGSVAETYAARVDLQRFNCLACHSRDGAGGLTSDQVKQMQVAAKAENADMIEAPTLTGVGHKLRTPWLRAVLTVGKRARPWMKMRMPQFGADNVGKLAEGLAALEGTAVDDTVHKATLSAEKIDMGRHLVGKNAFGCIACHDVANRRSTGARGPDLASSPQRVRYDWYQRWLEQPERMVPGTKMPAVFRDGKSLLANVLDGNAHVQAEALWGYLLLADKLPLPAGLEPGPKRRRRPTYGVRRIVKPDCSDGGD